jgi:hypothetical protein
MLTTFSRRKRVTSMNKTYEEMARQKCECSRRCKCTMSHEGGGCDGKGCSCWCHKPPSKGRVKLDEAFQRAPKKLKGGNGEDMED